jgi:hypothetical protein
MSSHRIAELRHGIRRGFDWTSVASIVAIADSACRFVERCNITRNRNAEISVEAVVASIPIYWRLMALRFNSLLKCEQHVAISTDQLRVI